VLIVECLNAVYGTMVAALLYYKKFVKSLTKHGFKLNQYDECVTNKIVKGKQITVCFHVDNCKISHKYAKEILYKLGHKQHPHDKGLVLNWYE
jgi:hypothetical protein